MGTYITLDIGKMELIGSKNDPGIDHGRLFHEKDRKPIVRDQDYSYECPNGFQTTLSEVLSTFLTCLVLKCRRFSDPRLTEKHETGHPTQFAEAKFDGFALEHNRNAPV
ncbi:HEPN/Toprim-associated domain-containing protein [Agrobacterium sp. lyk4-40-TYG-31]|uniref:HEPN/Toprim-associated domain-containing protein n=1 Tax=Agrobacterium sp. lyk4-40-TYG-31 TaxID=3040276 RepID=UPI000DD4F11B|nr:HEPN/Toprim-associated domain-containing protein [Agrobacterium sp. lyk4-40-TYG-31]